MNSVFFFQLFCTFLYVCGSYFLTGNYVSGEPHRFLIFTIMCLLATISAQSWGFFIGSTMPIKVSRTNWGKYNFSTKPNNFFRSFSDCCFHWTYISRFIFGIWILYAIRWHQSNVPVDVAHKLFSCWFSWCSWYRLWYESIWFMVSTLDRI